MLSKVVIVFLLLMVIVAMIGKAVFRKAPPRLGKPPDRPKPPDLPKPPVCIRCGRYLAGPGGCDCRQKG